MLSPMNLQFPRLITTLHSAGWAAEYEERSVKQPSCSPHARNFGDYPSRRLGLLFVRPFRHTHPFSHFDML